MKLYPFDQSGLATLLAFTMALSACSLAPEYIKPSSEALTSFKEGSADGKELLSTAGAWKLAQPSEALRRGEWWTVFDDPSLNALEQQAMQANQDLRAAAARVKESRAVQEVAHSDFLPNINAGFGPTRQQYSSASQFAADGQKGPSQTYWRAQGTASYEANLFGRVSDAYEATIALTEQNEAVFRSVTLALQADVAQNYFQLRELDAESGIFANTVALREEQLRLVQRRFDEGEINEIDVSQAASALATAKSEAMTVDRQRSVSEHRLAVLLGKKASQFTLPTSPIQPVSVVVPPGLPSALLERRPDISAAERAMASANARIGVAKSAYFPSLSLTGSAGFESSSLSNLFQWSSKTFLLGPLAGTALSVPIFDGGRRDGSLANARAIYEEQSARYREKVLVAFQEVENQLSNLRILRHQTMMQAQAVAASDRAAVLAKNQYSEGAVSYLNVIDSQRSALQAKMTAAQLTGVQAVSTVNLIRALGGGWDIPVMTPQELGASRLVSDETIPLQPQ